MTYDQDRVSSMVLKLWHHTDEDLRMEFVRHPVDEVRNLEAELERLREQNKQLLLTKAGAFKAQMEYAPPWKKND